MLCGRNKVIKRELEYPAADTTGIFKSTRTQKESGTIDSNGIEIAII